MISNLAGMSEASVSRCVSEQLEIVRVPEWAGIDFLVHGFSTRGGGQSTAFRSAENSGDLNLGYTARDLAENVAENRRLFLDALSESGPMRLSSGRLVTIKQIHSSVVHILGRYSAEEQIDLQGDGMITDQPGLLLGIQTADCIPVLVIDRKRRAIAAFHAGWRGTVNRIVEQGVAEMRSSFASAPEDLSAAIGPGIGSCCYRVGEEVWSAFTSKFRYGGELFSQPLNSADPETLLLDLAEANRRQLLGSGLADSSIYSAHECTACNTQRFFSYRAEHGLTGRMLSVVGILEA